MTGTYEPDAGQLPEDADPLAPLINQAREQGWSLIPSVGFGVVEHALMRTRDQWTTDVVTIPPSGYATVVRLHGAPDPDRPRRLAAPWWRQDVPVDVALDWLLSEADNDNALIPETRQQTHSQDQPGGHEQPGRCFAEFDDPANSASAPQHDTDADTGEHHYR